MTSDLLRSETDEDLIRRLPLPLAQLVRRSVNAKTALERHHAAFYLWEASLKLLGSAAIVHYARLDEHDPQLKERLEALARPSLGHWWEFVRLLLPVLAEKDPSFAALQEHVLGRARTDLPRVAGLNSLLGESLGGPSSAKSTVRIAELLDRMVQYRNAELGHGASGQKPMAFYEKMGATLLAANIELLNRMDLLAGRKLVHIEDVRRMASGQWLVERYDLMGETSRRLESLTYSEDQAGLLPRPGHVLLSPGDAAHAVENVSLHPLMLFESETGQAFFLNSRRKRMRAEYLCYTTGAVVQRDSLACEHRELMAQILDIDVTDDAIERWQTRSQAEDPDSAGVPEDTSEQRTLGDYELISRIGQGGMGTVYRAWQPSLGKQVALKTLLRSGDPKAEARFAREIRALGRVEHPNLVKVFTSGAHGEQWFYTMELIEGADLASVCDQLGGTNVRSLSRVAWQRAVSSACERTRQSEHPLSDDPTATSAGRPAGQDDGETGSEAATARAAATRGYIERAVEIIRQAALAAQSLHSAGVIHHSS